MLFVFASASVALTIAYALINYEDTIRYAGMTLFIFAGLIFAFRIIATFKVRKTFLIANVRNEPYESNAQFYKNMIVTKFVSESIESKVTLSYANIHKHYITSDFVAILFQKGTRFILIDRSTLNDKQIEQLNRLVKK